MKLPGTAAAYALIEAIFGSSGPGIHMGFLLVNSATIVLVFLLGRRLFGALGGVVASATYGLLSSTPAVLGFSAHATHFVVLPALGGTLLLLRAKESQKAALFFWSGLLLGLAPLMKQPGAFFSIVWNFLGRVSRMAGRAELENGGLPPVALANAALANCNSVFRGDPPIWLDLCRPA
jgi:4-amino-4-deoxy-L-arabinose transferase-like glycosyltransferase